MPSPAVSAVPVSPGLDRVAVLERTIGASIERVWENVLDWEHLPWLHRKDFARVTLVEAGDWGWRARAEATTQPGQPFVIELLVDRDAQRYVSRTVTGTGAGTEIWTGLEIGAADETRIRVEFWLPGATRSARAKVGEGYLRLYHRLWDEDEAMMRERALRLEEQGRAPRGADPRSLDLGPRAALLESLPRCVEVGGARWHVVLLDGALVVHDARCPHRLGPLGPFTGEPDDGPDAPAAPGQVECPWHGYRFDVRTGRSSDGRNLRLRAPPRIVHDAASDHITLVRD